MLSAPEADRLAVGLEDRVGMPLKDKANNISRARILRVIGNRKKIGWRWYRKMKKRR
jgi:hypothetical protein